MSLNSGAARGVWAGSALPTLGERLDRTGGVGPNFNLLRLAAAFAVLVSHAFAMPEGNQSTEPVWLLSGGRQTLGFLAVTVFFAMSGFLVTPSLVRSRSVARFALKRAVRILPALLVLLLVLSFVAGPLVSTLPVRDYFLDPGTYRYPLRTLYNASYGLPGVFESAPFSGTVDGSLWTLKYEAESYLVLALIGLSGLLRRPLVLLAGALATVAAAQVAAALGASHGLVTVLQTFLGFFQFFIVGATLAVWRDRVPVSKPLIALSLCVCALALVAGAYAAVAPLFLTYAVVSLGVLDPVAGGRLAPRGDYSYGLYLWAFPVQQLIQVALRGGVVLNVVLATPVALGLAVLSWTVVEKPALARAHAGARRPAPAG